MGTDPRASRASPRTTTKTDSLTPLDRLPQSSTIQLWPPMPPLSCTTPHWPSPPHPSRSRRSRSRLPRSRRLNCQLQLCPTALPLCSTTATLPPPPLCSTRPTLFQSPRLTSPIIQSPTPRPSHWVSRGVSSPPTTLLEPPS